MIDAKRLQRNLGIDPDGIIGRDTLKVLFIRFGASPTMASELALAANVHLRTYGILDTGLRLAHFLAQVVHESGGFRYMEEIWGPTAAQRGYEGRADLGNVQPGDGRRYQGRGPIQLTGRANYRIFGRIVGIDLEAHPEVVALPSVGLLVACLFWDRHELNVLADRDDLEGITRKVNGGTNGLSDRRTRLTAAKALVS